MKTPNPRGFYREAPFMTRLREGILSSHEPHWSWLKAKPRKNKAESRAKFLLSLVS